jgi:hypothetical protein
MVTDGPELVPTEHEIRRPRQQSGYSLQASNMVMNERMPQK